MLGASAGILGVVLLVLGGHGGAGAADGSAVPLGVALGLVAGAAYALYTFASGRVIGLGVSSRSTMGAVFGLGATQVAITTDKRFVDPSGTPRARIREDLRAIDEARYRARLAELLPAAQ